MASIKDVAFALNGEAQQQSARREGKNSAGIVKYGKKLPEIDPDKWYMFKLVDNSKKGGQYLPSVDDVIHPETNKMERMRLLAGVNTIWQKDQKDIDINYIKKNQREIKFARGVKLLRVRGIDETLVRFLQLTNANIGNSNRVAGARFEIYEYDSAAAEKEAFEKEEFELEMAIAAKMEKEDDMKKHAAFLGISMINPQTGEPKTADGIRREYVLAAKRNPHYFKQTLKTEQVEIAWLVKRAVGEGLIDIGREPGKLHWANGGGIIGAYPQTENPQQHLVNLAMTNTKDGREFKEQLKKIVT